MATHPHPYRLRPYHNPERVDESKVPDGWRFLYADEAGRPQNELCRAWKPFSKCFDTNSGYVGHCLALTYIVPVSA